MTPLSSTIPVLEGILLDVYHNEERVYLWIKAGNKSICLLDRFYPEIYISGEPAYEAKFLSRLRELDALHSSPERTERIDFYKNTKRSVSKVTLSKPSVLRTIASRLGQFYGRLEIFHSDLDVTTAYLLQKGIFPLTPVRFYLRGNEVLHTEPLASPKDLDYQLPNFPRLEMRFAKNHRIGLGPHNPLVFSLPDPMGGEVPMEEWVLYDPDPLQLLQDINRILVFTDPDIVVSSFGDQSIFPVLFGLSQKFKFPLLFDREPGRIQRKIITKGTSFETYGNMIYRAPSYPLFGRLHIDSANSFVFKEAMLYGIFELARLSRIPIQKMGRASTGTALTNIETEVAFRKNYLVPWQKAAIEQTKTAYELLRNDKGGLVFLPDIGKQSIYENVAQLDFAQMYPSIMSLFNISPETVNCSCCKEDSEKMFVPATNYHICKKRRGVVSEALEHILERRKYYKKRIKEASELSEIYEARQNALKWMLVTSFGYLGYRNAKFGRLESHEAVTAFGREVLLTAKEMAEKKGYLFLHAITDSLFIGKLTKEPFQPEELQALCLDIGKATSIDLKIEGIYDWLIFPASKTDAKIGVVNRYFGRFQSGELKIRGIFSRRKDIPLFIKRAQGEMLQVMQANRSHAELSEARGQLEFLVDSYYRRLLNGEVPIEELFLRRTVTKTREEYQNTNPASVSLEQLEELGLEVSPGEKVRYLVVQGPKKKPLYLAEESYYARPRNFRLHTDYYADLLVESLREIYEHLAPSNFFASLLERQPLLPWAGSH